MSRDPERIHYVLRQRGPRSAAEPIANRARRAGDGAVPSRVVSPPGTLSRIDRSFEADVGFFLLHVPALEEAATGSSTVGAAASARTNRFAVPLGRLVEPGFTRALITSACINELALACDVPSLLFSGIRAPEKKAGATVGIDGTFFSAPNVSGKAREARDARTTQLSVAATARAGPTAGALIRTAASSAMLHNGATIDFVIQGSALTSEEAARETQLYQLLFGPRAAVHHPTIPQQYGVQHSKLMLLWYPMGLRVIVMTSNLVPNEYQWKNQGAWVQDFPYKATVALPMVSSVSGFGDRSHECLAAAALDAPQERAVDSIATSFGHSLASFVGILATHLRGRGGGNARLGENHLLALSSVDFRAARAALVGSVPGARGGLKDGFDRATELYEYGQMRLRLLLSVLSNPLEAWAARQGLRPRAGVVLQASSLGFGLQPRLVESVVESLLHGTAPTRGPSDGAAAAAADAGTAGPSMLDRALVVWPSARDVAESVEGLDAGGWLLLPPQGDTDLLHRLACVWDGSITGRHRAMPHIKTYARVLEPLPQTVGEAPAAADDAAAAAAADGAAETPSVATGAGWWRGYGTPLGFTVLTSANLTQSAWGQVSESARPTAGSAAQSADNADNGCLQLLEHSRWRREGAAGPLHGTPGTTRQSINHFELGVVFAPALEKRRRELFADGRLPPVLATFSVSQQTPEAVAAAAARGCGLSPAAPAGEGSAVVPMPARVRAERPVVDVMLLQPTLSCEYPRLRCDPLLSSPDPVPELAWWNESARVPRSEHPPAAMFDAPAPAGGAAARGRAAGAAGAAGADAAVVVAVAAAVAAATEGKEPAESTAGRPRAYLRAALLLPLPHSLEGQRYSAQSPPPAPWHGGYMNDPVALVTAVNR